MDKNTNLSIVIPIYNDQEVLQELYKRLKSSINSITNRYEIVFVDDGSRDNSFEILKLLQQKDENIRIIKLTRNFGQSNAISAGLDYAVGDIVILMDSDLQDRPEDIPKLIDALHASNSSMSIAKWISKKDSLFRKAVSKIFYRTSEIITNIHHSPQLGVFRAIRRNALEEIRKIPEKTGTTLSLLYWSGFKYIPVELERDARYAGKSGYNLKRMISLTFDRIFSYSLFPIRMASIMGCFLGFFSILLGIIFVFKKIVLQHVVPGWTSIMVLMLFLFGINFLFVGVIGEYLGRVYSEAKGRPNYVIERCWDTKRKNKNA